MAGFRYNQDLTFVKEGAKGVWYEDGQFIHARYASDTAGLGKVLRWQLTPNLQRQEKKQDDFQVKCIYDPSFLTNTQDMLVWLGHASFFIRLGGISILTDPCLTDLPLIKRLVVPPCPISALENLNFLLLSHGHRDHFDEKVIRQLIEQNPTMTMLLPLEISRLLGRQRDFIPYQEAAWWQRFEPTKVQGTGMSAIHQRRTTGSPAAGMPATDDLEITFLPAKHWNRRWLNDLNRELWGSFWIRYGDTSIYFGGDSAYDSHFSEIREVMGEPDICLLPVGAYKPSFIMQSAHMSPTEALQAFHDLGGKVLVPMHYGTYDLSDEPRGEPLKVLQKAEEQGEISGSLKALAVGEVLPLETTKS